MSREVQLRNWVAAQFAGQIVRRTKLSYMDHLDFVAERVKHLSPFGYEIGLCHDLLEETAVGVDGLRIELLRLGYEQEEAACIANTTVELTDFFTEKAFPELSKAERKTREADRLMNIGPGAQTVKYADLLYNVNWTMAHDQEKALAYLRKKQVLTESLNKGDSGLRVHLLITIAEAIIVIRPRKHFAGLKLYDGKNRSMIDVNQLIIPAARVGDIPVLTELIAQKADLETRDDKGYSPLIIACYNHQYAAAELLLKAGADVNGADAGGNTALMGAAFKGYADIAELLISYGADLNLQHGNGGTALMFAAMFGRNELSRLLLEKGADKNIPNKGGSLAALAGAATAGYLQDRKRQPAIYQRVYRTQCIRRRNGGHYAVYLSSPYHQHPPLRRSPRCRGPDQAGAGFFQSAWQCGKIFKEKDGDND